MARKLFERDLIDDPNYQGGTTYDAHRIAFGKVGSATLNITLANLKTWLRGIFATFFLVRTNNLSDLNNKATARTNLDVYGKSETYSDTEIDAIEADTLAYLGGLRMRWAGKININNTVTKLGGDITISSSLNTETSVFIITHNLGTAQYFSLVSSGVAGSAYAPIRVQSTNTIQVSLKVNTDTLYQLPFDLIIWSL